MSVTSLERGDHDGHARCSRYPACACPGRRRGGSCLQRRRCAGCRREREDHPTAAGDRAVSVLLPVLPLRLPPVLLWLRFPVPAAVLIPLLRPADWSVLAAVVRLLRSRRERCGSGVRTMS